MVYTQCGFFNSQNIAANPNVVTEHPKREISKKVFLEKKYNENTKIDLRKIIFHKIRRIEIDCMCININ